MAIITKIEIQKRNKERVNLFLDGEYAFSFSVELVYREGLKINSEINSEKLKALVEGDNFIKCKEAALKIIEKTYKTEKQVVDKLKIKGYDDFSISKSIEFLKKYNFINDDEYTKNFIKNKLNSIGREKIKYELIRKGINKDIIDEELSSLNKENEKNIAFSIARKKFDLIKKKETNNYKISGKLYRYLISKGYGIDLSKDVIRKIISKDDEDF